MGHSFSKARDITGKLLYEVRLGQLTAPRTGSYNSPARGTIVAGLQPDPPPPDACQRLDNHYRVG